jgi:hypothetical protein
MKLVSKAETNLLLEHVLPESYRLKRKIEIMKSIKRDNNITHTYHTIRDIIIENRKFNPSGFSILEDDSELQKMNIY